MPCHTYKASFFKRWYYKCLEGKHFQAPSLVFGSLDFNVVPTWGFFVLSDMTSFLEWKIFSDEMQKNDKDIYVKEWEIAPHNLLPNLHRMINIPNFN